MKIMRKGLERVLIGLGILCSGCCLNFDKNLMEDETRERYVFDVSDLERNYCISPLFIMEFYCLDENKAEYRKFMVRD